MAEGTGKFLPGAHGWENRYQDNPGYLEPPASLARRALDVQPVTAAITDSDGDIVATIQVKWHLGRILDGAIVHK